MEHLSAEEKKILHVFGSHSPVSGYGITYEAFLVEIDSLSPQSINGAIHNLVKRNFIYEQEESGRRLFHLAPKGQSYLDLRPESESS
ncbi:MAG TPA: hypothetical protein PK014_00375 [Thermoanaerobaculia bacterium]|nr:hypothetical protein [Thermoanaerobaculia bacterium]HXK66927.1 hypothetical protein [Thermoanaerobaculia bacterium]